MNYVINKSHSSIKKNQGQVKTKHNKTVLIFCGMYLMYSPIYGQTWSWKSNSCRINATATKSHGTRLNIKTVFPGMVFPLYREDSSETALSSWWNIFILGMPKLLWQYLLYWDVPMYSQGLQNHRPLRTTYMYHFTYICLGQCSDREMALVCLIQVVHMIV